MADNFAFLLPVMMGTFSFVFFALARVKPKMPSALAWGIGFGAGAAAFSSELLPVPPQWGAIISDLLFFISFHGYGEGLLIRFQCQKLLGQRVAFATVCLLIDIYVVFAMESLNAELLLVDIALSITLLVPVVLIFTKPANVVDRALLIIAALVVLDTVVRVVVFDIIFKSSDALATYSASEYAFFEQISAGALGLCFALAALGSILTDQFTRYRQAAELDPLTGLLNRRGFEEAWARISDDCRIGAVMSCDIDHFKQINDRFGHAAGDWVIAELARKIADAVEPTAISARFGGEEFVAFLPGLDLNQAAVRAQIVCDGFRGQDWNEFGIDARVTVSVGVALMTSSDGNIHDAIGRSDRALYIAKADGRNRVALYGEELISPSLTSAA
jgi:diguanylate cyclase (GGDEF)-like protein